MQMLEPYFQDVRFSRLGGGLRDLPLQVSRDDADAAAPGATMQTCCLRGCCRFSAQASTCVSASVSAGCLGLPAPETALTDTSRLTQKCPRDYPPPECWAGARKDWSEWKPLWSIPAFQAPGFPQLSVV